VQRACRMEHIERRGVLRLDGPRVEFGLKSTAREKENQKQATKCCRTQTIVTLWCPAAEFLCPTRDAASWLGWPQRAGTGTRRGVHVLVACTAACARKKGRRILVQEKYYSHNLQVILVFLYTHVLKSQNDVRSIIRGCLQQETHYRTQT